MLNMGRFITNIFLVLKKKSLSQNMRKQYLGKNKKRSEKKGQKEITSRIDGLFCCFYILLFKFFYYFLFIFLMQPSQ